MSKYWETDKFKKLNAEWSKTLESTGFKDVETPDGALKEWDTNFFRNKFNYETYKAKEDYFRMITHIYAMHKFKDKVEKFMFAEHSDGASFRSISRSLIAKGVDLSIWQVTKRIKDVINLYRVARNDDGR